MTSRAGSAHIGSVFSAADILAALYGAVMRVDPQRPAWPARDRFLLSKGHAGAGIYAVLAERGFLRRALLDTYCADGSPLCGHVSHKGVPGVELSTGSLGHGLSVAAGMAYGAMLDGAAHRVFVLLSDGECDSGPVWEAALFASHHRLDRLVAIVDYNKIQSLASVADTLGLEPLAAKWRSFGWETAEVDGHDVNALAPLLAACPTASGRPTCVVAHTVKGKGVSFMENTVLWHYRSARGEEYRQALRELGESA